MTNCTDRGYLRRDGRLDVVLQGLDAGLVVVVVPLCLDRAQGLDDGLAASRRKVATSTHAARTAVTRSPDTLETPPARLRCPTGTSAMLRPAAAARICISRFQPKVSSRMPRPSSASRRMARNGAMSVKRRR